MVGVAHLFRATLGGRRRDVIYIKKGLKDPPPKQSKMLPLTALDLFNLFGFSVASLSITVALFYGVFVKTQEKSWRISYGVSQEVKALREYLEDMHLQVMEQEEIIKQQDETIKKIQGLLVYCSGAPQP